MKSNVEQVPYSEICKGKCTWYTWDEVCDSCGKQIKKYNEHLTTMFPDCNEEDLCLECLRNKFRA